MASVRRVLDAAYTAAAALAAVSLLLIFAVMMAQTALRVLGLQVPASDDISAYLCVSTTFFALAATFKPRRADPRRTCCSSKLAPGPRPAGGAGGARRWPRCVMAYVTFWTAQDMLVQLGDRRGGAGHRAHSALDPEDRGADRGRRIAARRHASTSSSCVLRRRASPSATWWPRKNAPPPAISRRRSEPPWIC